MCKIYVRLNESGLRINPNQHGGGGIKTTGVRTLAILSRMKVGVSILHVITIFGV